MRHTRIIEKEDGWSDWITPVMDGYKMTCCDCGLVHNMKFQALEVTKRHSDGSWEADELDTDKYHIQLKASRNERSTGQVRRHMK